MTFLTHRKINFTDAVDAASILDYVSGRIKINFKKNVIDIETVSYY